MNEFDNDPPRIKNRLVPRVSSERQSMSDTHNDIFFAAVETTRMPMILTDPRQPDNPIVFANAAFLQMTGYVPEEIVGLNCRFLQGPETDQATIAEVRDAVMARREISTEILNYRKNGSSFWNALYISPVYDCDGELMYFFASQLDVSRRRDAEDALRQSQKMEAVGQLTGGIAHDFNNLLQVVLGYSDIVRGYAERHDDAKLERAIGNIRTAAERGARLTSQLLAFARKQRLDGRPLNLNSLVDHLTDMAMRTLGANIRLELDMAPDLWNSRLDPVQAELAILNLLINARDAMPQGGTVTISTSNRVIAEADAVVFGSIPAGRYVSLDIEDTGMGMSADVLARVLDPFFTTKEEGKGTGLGLSMVYGFAKQSGGTIRLYSEPGQGTTAKLLFPVIDQGVVAPVATQPGPSTDRLSGDETILIVEDRADVGELAEIILEEFGYTILRCENAPEALALIEQHQDIDLLFSDLVMPGGLNGVALARETRKRIPRVKVLLTTGFAEASLERKDAGGSEFDIISKPYTRLELVRKIRLVLDGPTGVG